MSTRSTPLVQPYRRTPPQRERSAEPTAGIDWASDEHAVAVVDATGCTASRATVAHTKSGLSQLVTVLARARVREVGIERGDGPVVDALFGRGVRGVRDRPEPGA